MDFSAYPNLENAINAIGKVKETKLNKKRYAEMEANLSRISSEEFRKLDAEIVNATIVYNCLITPTALVNVGGNIVDIILLKDIVYIWGNVLTMRMCFIPYQKMNTVNVLSRYGYGFSIGPVSTGGFSKKDVVGDTIAQFRAVIEPQYKGVLYGWTKEREQAMMNDFSAIVRAVDEARNS